MSGTVKTESIYVVINVYLSYMDTAPLYQPDMELPHWGLQLYLTEPAPQ